MSTIAIWIKFLSDVISAVESKREPNTNIRPWFARRFFFWLSSLLVCFSCLCPLWNSFKLIFWLGGPGLGCQMLQRSWSMGAWDRRNDVVHNTGLNNALTLVWRPSWLNDVWENNLTADWKRALVMGVWDWKVNFWAIPNLLLVTERKQ